MPSSGASCPPTLEHDGKTRLRHFSYRAGAVSAVGNGKDLKAPRLPHHAALFAYTRWANLYSPHRAIAWGDIISGPLGSQFNLSINGNEICGIRDIAELPERDETGRPKAGAKLPFFSHTKYWLMPRQSGPAPHHVVALREALNLRSG